VAVTVASYSAYKASTVSVLQVPALTWLVQEQSRVVEKSVVSASPYVLEKVVDRVPDTELNSVPEVTVTDTEDSKVSSVQNSVDVEPSSDHEDPHVIAADPAQF